MDVEATIARALRQALNVPAYLEVPADAPDSFIVVEQTAVREGSDHVGRGILATASIDIDCWALKNQRKQAAALADSVAHALPDLSTSPITTSRRTNCYRENDPDTGRSRYIVQIETTFLKED